MKKSVHAAVKAQLTAENPVEPVAVAEQTSIMPRAAEATVQVAAMPDTAQPVTVPGPEPFLLEGWTPTGDSLHLQLHSLAWQPRATDLFTSQQVPYLQHQSGFIAGRTAEVLFAHCLEQEERGTLEPEIHVLELAMGLGLHAVQLLDRFERLCNQRGRDWYSRLTLWATDAALAMVETAQERRVFERHRDHVRLGVADLTEPASVRTLDGERVQLGGKLRAIIHTYALQTLPSLALQRVRRSTPGGDMSEWAVLVAQTLLTDPVAAQKLLPFTPEEIRELAQKGPAERSQLLPILPLISCKFALAGIELEQIELGEQAESCADALSQALDLQRPLELAAGEGWETLWVNLPGAALASIRRSLDALKPDGFLLYRDLGPATADGANAPLTHRTYGPVAWTPVNHFLLDRWMARPVDLGGLGAHVSMPAKEVLAPVQTRLVSHSPLPRTRTALALHFDPRAFEAQERLVAEARALANAGDQRALDGYRAALQVERDDWRVLAEAGEVALRNLGSPESARMFLSEALRINPWYDAPAWLAWADLNWGLGQRSAAREAIERAVAASPGHARPHAAQAALAVQERRWPLALEAVGKALARESDAETRTKLLELQRQALAQLYGGDANAPSA